MYRQCTVYIVQCTDSVHCTLCNVQTVYSVHCTMYTDQHHWYVVVVLCLICYNIKCTQVKCRLSTVLKVCCLKNRDSDIFLKTIYRNKKILERHGYTIFYQSNKMAALNDTGKIAEKNFTLDMSK